jgi:hypothetical protein
MATYFGRAVEDPTIVARLTQLLEQRWDPAGALRTALRRGTDFYREQAVVIAGMLSANARETEVQRYLRQLEQQALPRTLHPADVRHDIAVRAWRITRGLDP